MSRKTIFRSRNQSRLRRRSHKAVIAAILAAATLARGDQIKTGGVNHPDARIVSVERDRLLFRSSDGLMHTARLDEIEQLIVDRGALFEDFNQAERFLGEGEPQKAISRYERALRVTQEFWPELVASRLVIAHDRAGQLDRAVFYWIRLVGGRWTGPAAAARLIPRHIPDKRDGRSSRSVELLGEAIRREGEEVQRTLMEVLQFEILRRCGDERAGEAAARIIERGPGAAIRTEGVYAILLSAMEAAATRNRAGVLSALDRAIRDCPDGSLAGFLMLKGRLSLQTATGRDEVIRAAWCFMRVVIHMQDDPAAPKALLEAAQAMVRLERPDRAASLVEESLTHPRMDMETRRKAETMLADLQRFDTGKQ